MRLRFIFTFAIVIILLGGGTLFYNYYEGWSYTDSLYFSTITLTTIGYGDLHPTTNFTKLFTVFYAIVGVGIMLYLIGSVVSKYIFEQERKIENAIARSRRLHKKVEEELPKKKTTKKKKGKTTKKKTKK